MSAPEDWTVEEANAALPRVRNIVERLRANVEALRGHVRATQETVAAGANGHSQDRGGAFELQEAAAELAAEGVVVRDLDSGLVDFPAMVPDGRRYWLCWVAGEPEVAWWHWPEDGFAGRRPLSDPPE